MDGNIAAVLVAVCGAVPATLAALSARRTHREVRTNHGVRAGERIEKLGDDMFTVKGELADLKTAFVDHARTDLEFQERVEPLLKGAQN